MAKVKQVVFSCKGPAKLKRTYGGIAKKRGTTPSKLFLKALEFYLAHNLHVEIEIPASGQNPTTGNGKALPTKGAGVS